MGDHNAIMDIISLDPGVSTGFCWIYYNPETLCGFYSLKSLCTYDIATVLVTILNRASDCLVIERMPDIKEYMLIKSCVEVNYIQTAYISPGEWKPIAKAQKWKVPDAKTQHEKDAYNLARFYFLMYRKLNIGALRV